MRIRLAARLPKRRFPGYAQLGALDNFTFGAALPQTVPEPSSFVLLSSGLLLAAAAFRRGVLRS
ncbi:MAG TPA: PEP-CTERM sorting domain-containing protein [Acidobacteriaceae bacterium]